MANTKTKTKLLTQQQFVLTPDTHFTKDRKNLTEAQQTNT